MDNYERLERWMADKLDTGFIFDGRQFSWTSLNQDVADRRDQPDAARGALKQTLLGVYNRERKDAEDRGLDITHLEGMKEYIEKKLFSGTRREKSWKRLVEDKLKFIDESGRTFTGFDVFEELERTQEKRKEKNKAEREAVEGRKTSFRGMETQIAEATDEQLSVLKKQIPKLPITKGEKDILKRRIFIKEKDKPYEEIVDEIITGIKEATTSDQLRDEIAEAKTIPIKIDREQIEKEIYEKKMELGLPVQKTILTKYFGDIEDKIFTAVDMYGEDFWSEPKQQLRAIGFSETEIDKIKETKGKIGINVKDKIPRKIEEATAARGVTIMPPEF